MCRLVSLVILLALGWGLSLGESCNRTPQGATAGKSPVDDNFVLSVANNAQSYVPGQKYNGKRMSSIVFLHSYICFPFPLIPIQSSHAQRLLGSVFRQLHAGTGAGVG